MTGLTDVQSHAAGLLRKLSCARHDQLHLLISKSYPKVKPENAMRRIVGLGKATDDVIYYFWQNCGLAPERIAAVDIMLHICGDSLSVFDVAYYPCALIFYHIRPDGGRPYLVYTPRDGLELECRAAIVTHREPEGHTAVIYICDKSQIPLLEVPYPHMFVIGDGDGGY